jgi:hypothetical protein
MDSIPRQYIFDDIAIYNPHTLIDITKLNNLTIVPHNEHVVQLTKEDIAHKTQYLQDVLAMVNLQEAPIQAARSDSTPNFDNSTIVTLRRSPNWKCKKIYFKK